MDEIVTGRDQRIGLIGMSTGMSTGMSRFTGHRMTESSKDRTLSPRNHSRYLCFTRYAGQPGVSITYWPAHFRLKYGLTSTKYVRARGIEVATFTYRLKQFWHWLTLVSLQYQSDVLANIWKTWLWCCLLLGNGPNITNVCFCFLLWVLVLYFALFIVFVSFYV